ncbi:MAG: flagellar hook-basal body protein FliE [Rhodospirillaceae bacterium]|nr:flagellar hook-basal body protein FliE [Rhodospirillaceae bacterium]|tara:strand:- start:744 stop:1079 length:336 start_codon:yes stop_codon:yes gene_type:complete
MTTTADFNIHQALNAYQQAARQTVSGSSQQSKAEVQPAGQEEFGDLVRSAIMEARKIGERSEQMSIAAINDRADITQVVTAVAEAELTLQTVVNVRDKVLEAYKDIIRMPV